MSNYSGASEYSQPGAPAHPSAVLTQQDFLSRVDYAKSEIRSLGTNISEIASLHQRSLSSADNSTSAQLEGLVTQTQLKNTQIRDQIKYLELDALKTTDGSKSIKNLQSKQLKETFQRALQDYQQEEVGFRQRYREQIARQFRIVNPEATEAEVQQASELDWGSEGVFQTAVSYPSSNPRHSMILTSHHSSRATAQDRLHPSWEPFEPVTMNSNASKQLSPTSPRCSKTWPKSSKPKIQSSNTPSKTPCKPLKMSTKEMIKSNKPTSMLVVVEEISGGACWSWFSSCWLLLLVLDWVSILPTRSLDRQAVTWFVALFLAWTWIDGIGVGIDLDGVSTYIQVQD